MAHEEPSDIVAEKLAQAHREDRAERDEAIAREIEGTARLAEALARSPKDKQ